jgi:hypothetical protein
VAAAAHLVAFVAPERMESLLQALPATALLTRLFEISPYVLLAAVGIDRCWLRPRPKLRQRKTRAKRELDDGLRVKLAPCSSSCRLALLLLTGAGLAWVTTCPSDSPGWPSDCRRKRCCGLV